MSSRGWIVRVAVLGVVAGVIVAIAWTLLAVGGVVASPYRLLVNYKVSAPGNPSVIPSGEALLPEGGSIEKAAEFRGIVSAFLRRHSLVTTGHLETNLLGADGWYLGAEELQLALLSHDAYSAAAVEIGRFAQAVQNRGIDMLVVPMPAKWEVYPEAIPGFEGATATAVSLQRLHLIRLLKDAGVQAVDLGPVLRAAATSTPERLLYHKADHHWTPAGAEIAARFLAERLPEADDPLVLEGTPTTLSFTGATDLLIQCSARRFPTFDGHLKPYPVVLMGDSFSFPHGQSTRSKNPELIGFPALLAHASLQGNEVISFPGGSGSGIAARRELARRAAANPGYLNEKKTIIWQLNPIAFLHHDAYFPRIDLPDSVQGEVPNGTERDDKPKQLTVVEVPKISVAALGTYRDAVVGILCKDSSGTESLCFTMAIRDRTIVAQAKDLNVGQRLRLVVTDLAKARAADPRLAGAFVFEPEGEDFGIPTYWISQFVASKTSP